ncbi:MAG: SAM-dependent methyltransferase [Acidiferrobacterales bacterium]
MTPTPIKPRLLFLSISLLSAAAIGYEILLMRLLSIIQWYHFAYMIISLALLGYGVSGTVLALGKRWLAPRFAAVYVASATLSGIAMIVCFALAQRIPFNALEVVWDPRQLPYLAAIYLLFFIPFFFAASCIALSFVHYKELISRIYFADLLGAGVGAAGIILALFLFRPEACLKLLAVIALAAAVVGGLDRALRLPRWVVPALGGGAAAVVFALPQSWIALQISPYKGLSQALQVMGTRVLGEYTNPLGLLTVVESPTIPFRYAPGLSLRTRHEPPPQLGVFTDGDALSAINRYSGKREELSYLDDSTAALPYHLLQHPKVLVLGAGGGSDVLLARYHEARSIDAVELNPLMIDLVRNTYARFAGDVYGAEDVRVHVAEARGFVARSAERFDLIHVALLDSFAASSAGVHALSESYIYTVEAMQEYLAHLAPGGMLAITRWFRLPPRDSLKLFATAVAALEQAGVFKPGTRLALIRGWATSTLVVKNGALTQAEIASIRAFSRARSFDVAYYPGITASEANRFNVLDQPYLFEGATALLGTEREEYQRRYKFYIEPATDDNPHFFHFFKWRVLPELLMLHGRGGAPLIEWGYLILIVTIVQAVIAGSVLIVLPLWVAKHPWPVALGVRMGFYFFALGLAFIFIEIAFIQKFMLFLSHPLYAVAVVLSGFLVFAGLGSGYSRRLVHRMQATAWSPVAVAVTGIVAIATAYLFLLPAMSHVLVGLPDTLRVLLAFALLAPLAFCMGMPFPLGLDKVAARAPDFIPWAWGINGFASVLSATLATLIAIELGFTVVVTVALVLYVLAALLIRKVA